MIKEETTTLLKASLERFAALGVPRLPDDLQTFLRYREGLTTQERAMFDDLIERGAFPGAAAETVEIAAGRQKPQDTTKAGETANIKAAV